MKISLDLSGGSVLNTKNVLKSIYVQPALYRLRNKTDSFRSSITILI